MFWADNDIVCVAGTATMYSYSEVLEQETHCGGPALRPARCSQHRGASIEGAI